jgi:hypothetical protein
MSAVLVTWHDASSEVEGWTHIADLDRTPTVVHTCGLLLAEHEGGRPGHVSIYQSRIDGTDQIDSVIHIPQPMVQHIRVLFDAV